MSKMIIAKAFEQGKSEARRIYADADNCPYRQESNEEAAWLGGYHDARAGKPSQWADDYA